MKKEKKERKKGVLLVTCYLRQMDRDNLFTAANYRNALHSVRRFLGEEADVFEVGAVSREWVLRYILYMRETEKLSAGSADSYMRMLRAVYNKAVQEGLVGETEEYPFNGVHIVVPPTLKRALSDEELKRLNAIDLSGNKRLSFARDLFLFLFYARGMCFVDVFNLQYSEVSGGYIRYTRSKTGAPLNVKIEPVMQVLMDRYREAGNDFVFPSLHRNCYKPSEEVCEPTACRRTNRQLNALGEKMGLTQSLTAYVARHTWASSAEASGMSISYTSQGLGHSSERVTHIYMKGIPSSKMDEANREMIDKILGEEKTDENSTDNEDKKERCLILCKNETSGVLIDRIVMINIAYLPANVCIII